MSTTRDITGPGQQSVWDFPSPPIVVPVEEEVEVWLGGRRIAWTDKALKVLEKGHPPVYYVPPHDVDWAVLRWSAYPAAADPHLGIAHYLDIEVIWEGRKVSAQAAAYAYESPPAPYEELRGHLAFYAGSMDACLVGGEAADPQPGSVFAGWVTSDVVGPFVGE